MSIRILVADDRDLIRAGLREFVGGTDLEVIAEASIRDALKVLRDRPTVQLVVLGAEPPGTEGLALLDQLKASAPGTPVLLYVARTSAELIAAAIARGANGMVLHEASRSTFIKSVHSVVGGESLWSREDLRRAGSAARSATSGTDVQLTRRESEVIVKMVEGLTNKQIAVSLGISYETVKEHVQHVLRKVGVTDRTQAAVWAVRHRLV
ncbi:MAG: response regulator transcription factor [Planctomycetota bacterium]